MRNLWIIVAGVAAAALSACDGGVNARTAGGDETDIRISSNNVQTNKRQIRVGSRLECPEREGDLRLTSAASDGRSCSYRSQDGDAEVQLQLATLNGTAETHLRALETDLRRLVPAAAAAAAAAPQPPQPPTPGEDEIDGRSGDGDARVVLPGVSVNAQGERASIRLPGVTINADEGSADIRVRDDKDGETVSVRANDGGAEIRARGDSTRAGGDLSSTYLLASKTAGPAGWRVAGYKAQGPGAGPLVVGVLRAKGRHDGDLMDDVEDLIERNVRR